MTEKAEFVPLPEGGLIVIGGQTFQISQLERIQLHHKLRVSEPVGRLSKEAWDKFDDFLFQHGWGGYYDFLEQLRDTASLMGAGWCTADGYLDLYDIKTIPKMMALMQAWAWCLNTFNVHGGIHDNWELYEEVREFLKGRRNRLDKF